MNSRRIDAFNVLLLVALCLRIVSAPTANLSYFLVALVALFSRSLAIQALVMSWVFSMINPGLAPEASSGAIGRYAILLAAAFSVLIRSSIVQVRPLTACTLLLGLFLVFHSIVFSPVLDVSMLKAISWSLAMATIVSAWFGLDAGERERLSSLLFWGLVSLLLLSLPLLMLPAIGYLRNGTGFQGVLNHPQAFGPTMAILGVWAGSRIFAHSRPPWSLLSIFIGCFVMIVLSEARTAGLAMVLGLGGALFITPALAGRAISSVLPGVRSKRFVGFLVLIGILALASGPLIAEKVVGYIFSKSGRQESTSILDAYETSRGGLIEKMASNISARPLEGIGFGMASIPSELVVVRDPVFGLPVSAAVEKGVLPLAIVEEIGVVGFGVVLLWVLALLRMSARAGVAPVAVCLTALFLNMGEATLFSPGGLGLLMLIMLGWAASSSLEGEAR